MTRKQFDADYRKLRDGELVKDDDVYWCNVCNKPHATYRSSIGEPFGERSTTQIYRKCNSAVTLIKRRLLRV